MSKRRCPFGQCDWKPIRGTIYERCVKCGDGYPCRKACRHFDCWMDRIERGKPLPADFQYRNEQKPKHPVKGIVIADVELDSVSTIESQSRDYGQQGLVDRADAASAPASEHQRDPRLVV